VKQLLQRLERCSASYFISFFSLSTACIVFLYDPSFVHLQIADERKTHAEQKDEEVKLLESSIEELESTIFALENQVTCLHIFQC
jgi:hypothetical protein